MKRVVFLFLLALSLLISVTAFATDLEIVYPNVNFRSEPGGNVIGTFNGGEVLTALDETWAKDQLWYHAHSDVMGDGYVAGEYARPIWKDERVFDPEKPMQTDYVTDNVLAFYESLQRYFYQFGFCYWDSKESVCTFRVNDGVGDPNVVRPATKWDLAYMLLRYGLLVENEETTLLRNENAPYEELLQASSAALLNHFGTDDIWKIILNRRLLFHSEAHAPHGELSTNDLMKTSAIWDKVNAEYSQKETNQAATDAHLVLYYNPNGGYYYHTDANCRSIAAKYLPLSGTFMWEAVNAEEFAGLMPCNVCGAPER